MDLENPRSSYCMRYVMNNCILPVVLRIRKGILKITQHPYSVNKRDRSDCKTRLHVHFPTKWILPRCSWKISSEVQRISASRWLSTDQRTFPLHTCWLYEIYKEVQHRTCNIWIKGFTVRESRRSFCTWQR